MRKQFFCSTAWTLLLIYGIGAQPQDSNNVSIRGQVEWSCPEEANYFEDRMTLFRDHSLSLSTWLDSFLVADSVVRTRGCIESRERILFILEPYLLERLSSLQAQKDYCIVKEDHAILSLYTSHLADGGIWRTLSYAQEDYAQDTLLCRPTPTIVANSSRIYSGGSIYVDVLILPIEDTLIHGSTMDPSVSTTNNGVSGARTRAVTMTSILGIMGALIILMLWRLRQRHRKALQALRERQELHLLQKFLLEGETEKKVNLEREEHQVWRTMNVRRIVPVTVVPLYPLLRPLLSGSTPATSNWKSYQVHYAVAFVLVVVLQYWQRWGSSTSFHSHGKMPAAFYLKLQVQNDKEENLEELSNYLLDALNEVHIHVGVEKQLDGFNLIVKC